MLISKIEGSPSCILGKGIFWDVETQNLYYTDMFGKTIHRYDPASGKHSSAHLDGRVSIIIPVEGVTNQFIVTETNKLCKVSWNGVSNQVRNQELIAELPLDNPSTEPAFNDGKVDPAGRLWIGTMTWSLETDYYIKDKAALYSLDRERRILNKHIDKISISNGLDWINDKMYYADGSNINLGEYLYDRNDGKLSKFFAPVVSISGLVQEIKKISCNLINNTHKPALVLAFNQYVFSLDKHNLKGAYGGLAADVDGNLWIARHGEGTVIKINPNKPETLLEIIELPCENPTNVAFGGPNLDELYVTTSILHMSSKAPVLTGGLFKITGLGTKGLPMRRVQF